MAAGTACGTPSNLQKTTVYVDGGTISCAQAKDIIEKYTDKASSAQNSHFSVTVDGFDCAYNLSLPRTVENRNAVCVNHSTGAYVDARPSSLHILAGPIAEAGDYTPTTTPSADRYQSGNPVLFSTPDQSTGCGIDAEGTLTCYSLAKDQESSWKQTDSAPMRQVTLSATGTPQQKVVPEQGPTDEMTAKSLDQGTVLNAWDFSCQATGSGTMHCVSPTQGFTISEDGYTRD